MSKMINKPRPNKDKPNSVTDIVAYSIANYAKLERENNKLREALKQKEFAIGRAENIMDIAQKQIEAQQKVIDTIKNKTLMIFEKSGRKFPTNFGEIIKVFKVSNRQRYFASENMRIVRKNQLKSKKVGNSVKKCLK